MILQHLASCLSDQRHVTEKGVDYRARLGELLLQYSYKKGTFTLTSGKTSDFYIDFKATALTPEGGLCTGMVFCDMIADLDEPVQAVAGVTLGADALVSDTSLVGFLRGMHLERIIIRKESKGHGTNKYLERSSRVVSGTSVALLEDVVTTGGTLFKAIERLEAEDLRVKIILVGVDREEGGCDVLREKGYDVRSIYTRTQLLALGSPRTDVNFEGQEFQA